VQQGDTLNVVGSDKTTTVTGQYNVTADARFSVTQGGDLLDIQNGVLIHSAGPITVENNGCHVTMNGGKVEVSGASGLLLKGGDDAWISLENGVVTIHGTQKVVASGASSALELAKPGAKVSGTKTTLAAKGVNEISGALIKIN
jgi:hypothetical protein